MEGWMDRWGLKESVRHLQEVRDITMIQLSTSSVPLALINPSHILERPTVQSFVPEKLSITIRRLHEGHFK